MEKIQTGSNRPSSLNYAGLESNRVSLIAQLVMNLPEMQETPVQFLGQEDLLVKG